MSFAQLTSKLSGKLKLPIEPYPASAHWLLTIDSTNVTKLLILFSKQFLQNHQTIAEIKCLATRSQFRLVPQTNNTLVKSLDFNCPRWLQKLQVIHDFLSKDPSVENQAVLDIYLSLILSERIQCEELGGHHRPYHHAKLAYYSFARISLIQKIYSIR